MNIFGFGKKIDTALIPYLSVTSRKKLPVIICYKSNLKNIKSKILSSSGKIKYEYSIINAVSCEITSSGIDRLSELPEVSFICFDYKAILCLRKSHDTLYGSYVNSFNYTGKGLGIGIIDSGVYPHPDLVLERNSIVYFKDLINSYEKPYDDNGHGTFISGCIASSGIKSNKMNCGFAKDSNICMIKAFNTCGNGYLSDIIYGIENLILIKDSYNIKVICLPFEIPYINKLKVNPLEDIINIAISKNIAVVAPSGNLGPYPYSIYCPGNIKDVITVSGLNFPDKNNKNCYTTFFSGRGPLKDGISKPDFGVPCINITSLSSDVCYIPLYKKAPEIKNPYNIMSGTSISCAIISAICLLILEKNPNLTPRDLKSILCLSSISIGESKYSCGSGMFVFDKIIK